MGVLNSLYNTLLSREFLVIEKIVYGLEYDELTSKIYGKTEVYLFNKGKENIFLESIELKLDFLNSRVFSGPKISSLEDCFGHQIRAGGEKSIFT